VPYALCAALLALSLGCGEAPAPDGGPSDLETSSADPAAPAPELAEAGGPPLGRYVCRQYTTTMGYLTLEEGGTYEVSGVRGRYRHDPQSGAMNWQGGSYDEWGWEGTYEHVARPEGDGRPDEDIIRLVGEADGLKIDCYKTAE
jgi:hypothetical protein